MAYTKSTNGYRAYLPCKTDYLHDDQPEKKGFGYIGFYKLALCLTKTNQRAAKCLECKGRITAGTGIFHRQFHANGYVCLTCAKKLIAELGQQYGFGETPLFNLGTYTYKHPSCFTVQQVCDAIRLVDDVLAEISNTPIAINIEPMPFALELSAKVN